MGGPVAAADDTAKAAAGTVAGAVSGAASAAADTTRAAAQKAAEQTDKPTEALLERARRFAEEARQQKVLGSRAVPLCPSQPRLFAGLVRGGGLPHEHLQTCNHPAERF
jgi:hypothetical protein